MTTIAYRDGVMAGDSLAFSGYEIPIGHKVKIRRLKDGTLAGVSTPQPGGGEALLDWLEARGGPYHGLLDPDLPAVGEFDLLAVTPDGRGWYAKDAFTLTGPLEAPWYVIGSGVKAAIAAFHLGATAETAVKIAAKVDRFTAEPVHTLTHEVP